MARGQAIVADVVKGVAAGAAATWVMNLATTWMYESESDAAKERENEARGDRTAYESAAEAAARAAQVELSDRQRSRAGTALHWATGIIAGAAYAVARRRWPSVRSVSGMPFGIGFYLALDEVMNPVMGFTPGPLSFPWQTHARGLGGHVIFGAVNDLVLRGLDRVTPSPAR